MENKTVLSCIQPTGSMHLGNYFGATQNWVKLQEDFKCRFGVVNYHAQTLKYVPKELNQNTLEMAIELLAIGVKPENLFIQSLIPEHTDLGWILANFTSFYDLLTQAQFQEKAGIKPDVEVDEEGNHVLRYNPKAKSFTSQGLFHYPVLQAADILIYNAELVPVGKDQVHHLELARGIARRFNRNCGVELFKEPKPLLTETPKIQSLLDPTAKMSKSHGEKHIIGLFDSEETIAKKVKAAVTDGQISEDTGLPMGVENLLTLLKASGNMPTFDEFFALAKTEQLRYVDLKQELSTTLNQMIAPFREEKGRLMGRKAEVKEILKGNSAKIRREAKKMLKEAKKLAGLF